MGSAAFGTVFKIGATPVAELTDISGPSVSVDEVDVTHHTSTDAYREFVAGVIDGGEVSLEGNATQDNLSAMFTQLNSRSSTAMTIDFPAGTVNDITFSGFFTALEPSAPFEDKLSFSATVKVTGKPNLGS